MPFNALYGLKNTPPLKRNFYDLYVYKNYPQTLICPSIPYMVSKHTNHKNSIDLYVYKI
jgi:hypothetical protein